AARPGPGLARSRARPGGNGTGLANQGADLAAKRLELLREVVPGLRRLAIIANIDYPAVVLEMREFQAAADTLGLEVATLEIRRGEDIVPAFEAIEGRTDALYVCADPLVVTHQVRINTLALAAAGYNFSLLLRWFGELLRVLSLILWRALLATPLHLTRCRKTFFTADEIAKLISYLAHRRRRSWPVR